jgi:murein L,D-transpeptidase YafK
MVENVARLILILLGIGSTLGGASDKVPEYLVELGTDQAHAILVDKAAGKLFLLKNEAGRLKTQLTLDVATGKVKGQKKRVGDHKTPEGIYWPQSFLSQDDLKKRFGKLGQSVLSLYGIGAVVLDYPNQMDQVKNRKGGGIWIHGSDEDSRPQERFDTRGCVVLTNKDYHTLQAFINIQETPVLIFDSVPFIERNLTSNQGRMTYERMLRMWQKAWSSKDIQTFMSYYHETNFESKNMDYGDWKAYKTKLFNLYSGIQVDIDFDRMMLVEHNKYVYVQFQQRFSTTVFSDYGVKRLQIQKEPLKIVHETFFDQPLAAQSMSAGN